MKIGLTKRGYFMLLVLKILLVLNAVCYGAQLRVPGKIISVHDGDTFIFQTTLTLSAPGAKVDGSPVRNERVTFTISVRLVDLNDPTNPRGCWAPELDQRGGKVSRNNLQRMANGQDCTLIINLDAAFTTRGRGKEVANVSRLLTLERVLADALVEPYKTTLGRRQINAGYAKAL